MTATSQKIEQNVIKELCRGVNSNSGLLALLKKDDNAWTSTKLQSVMTTLSKRGAVRRLDATHWKVNIYMLSSDPTRNTHLRSFCSSIYSLPCPQTNMNYCGLKQNG